MDKCFYKGVFFDDVGMLGNGSIKNLLHLYLFVALFKIESDD
jgi:hypothetical protein